MDSRVSLLDAVPVHNIGLLHRALVIVIVGASRFVGGLLSLGTRLFLIILFYRRFPYLFRRFSMMAIIHRAR